MADEYSRNAHERSIKLSDNSAVYYILRKIITGLKVITLQGSVQTWNSGGFFDRLIFVSHFISQYLKIRLR